MRITLKVNGRKRSFTEEELIAILKEHFSGKAKETIEVEKKPIEGKAFKVEPKNINRKLFEEKRNDVRQEWTRQIILEAFTEVDANPEKYANPFKTLIPKKTWSAKTIEELKELSSKLGRHNADWVEQALEWAQRINNGESWKAVCNDPDTANWYRLVIWKDNSARLIGGSRKFYDSNSASVFTFSMFGYDAKLNNTVPLVVL